MDTIKMTLEMPRDIVETMNISQIHIAAHFQELIALELYQKKQISTGKGAEIVGISKLSFIRLLSQNGLFCFTETADVLLSGVTALALLLESTI